MSSPVSMKSIIFTILVVAVKAGKVYHDQYDQVTLFDNDVHVQHKIIDNRICENSIPYLTSQLTVTSTSIWLNSVPVTSLVLSSTLYTIFVTHTEYATTIITDYEPPCTVTGLPAFNSKYVTVTDTQTEVVDKSYYNVRQVTDTTTLNAEAIEVSAECSYYTVPGETSYVTRTTYWTHTQTRHDKVMVGTEVDVLVTSTHLVSNAEEEDSTKYVTQTETITNTEFYTSYHNTASTLWITHTVKEECW